MAGLAVRLFGPLEVRSDDGRDERPAALKAQELLCYLLLHCDQPVPRRMLSCLLWADYDPARSRKNLRQALWQLHSTIGPVETTAGDLLEITAETVTLRATASLWIDVTAFQTAFRGVRVTPSERLSTGDAALMDDAIRLYRGDLLEGMTFEWCIVEREWLQSTYLAMLDKLMVYCEVNGEYERGIDYGESILRCDRAREYTHRRLMYLHHLRGNRTGALRQYARCLTALEEELGVLPARSTTRLCELIRTDGEVDPLIDSPSAILSGRPATAVRARDRLRRVQQALTDLQREISADLLAFESESPNHLQ